MNFLRKTKKLLNPYRFKTKEKEKFNMMEILKDNQKNKRSRSIRK